MYAYCVRAIYASFSRSYMAQIWPCWPVCSELWSESLWPQSQSINSSTSCQDLMLQTWFLSGRLVDRLRFGVPVWCLAQRQSKEAPNGVLRDTSRDMVYLELAWKFKSALLVNKDLSVTYMGIGNVGGTTYAKRKGSVEEKPPSWQLQQ